MNRFRIPNIIKFAIGTFLVQGATALLVIGAQPASLTERRVLVFCLSLLIGLLAALWFASIARHSNQHALAKAREKFNKERERIHRQNEREKTKEINDSHRQLVRETRRAQRRSNVKLGSALAGLATISVALFFTQFMTLGLLALFLGSAGLLGYTLSARWNHLPGKHRSLANTSFERMFDKRDWTPLSR